MSLDNWKKYPFLKNGTIEEGRNKIAFPLHQLTKAIAFPKTTKTRLILRLRLGCFPPDYCGTTTCMFPFRLE